MKDKLFTPLQVGLYSRLFLSCTVQRNKGTLSDTVWCCFACFKDTVSVSNENKIIQMAIPFPSWWAFPSLCPYCSCWHTKYRLYPAAVPASNQNPHCVNLSWVFPQQQPEKGWEADDLFWRNWLWFSPTHCNDSNKNNVLIFSSSPSCPSIIFFLL